MAIAALLIPLIPGLLDTIARIITAARSDPALTPEQLAALDALAIRLDETAQAVEAVEIRDV
jgi:hypothetical protein